MRPASFLASITLVTASLATAHAEPATTFDGAWNVTLTCPPHNDDDEAKGYTHRFRGEVENGKLRAVHGTEGEPGWHLVTGTIEADGNAILRVHGIVNNAAYAINNAQRGKEYRYRVRAHFEADRGSGERMTGRVCTFRFAR